MSTPPLPTNQDSQQQVRAIVYWLESARRDTAQAMEALHQVLDLTGAADKTINQLISQENLVGYSTIGNISLLQIVYGDLEDHLLDLSTTIAEAAHTTAAEGKGMHHE